MTNSLSQIRWLWALLGGFLAEVALVAVAVPFYFPSWGQTALLYVVPPACLVITFLMGLWIAGKAKGNFLLNGALVGLVAALLYAPAFFFGESLPLSYQIAEVLKVVGGVAGGAAVARAKARAEVTSAG